MILSTERFWLLMAEDLLYDTIVIASHTIGGKKRVSFEGAYLTATQEGYTLLDAVDYEY